VVDLDDGPSGESVPSSTSASSSASPDVCSILIERKRLGGAGIDLGTSTFELGIPRRARIRVRLSIETAKKLESQAGSFFGRKPKDLSQDVGGRHSDIMADDPFRRRTSVHTVA